MIIRMVLNNYYFYGNESFKTNNRRSKYKSNVSIPSILTKYSKSACFKSGRFYSISRTK